ncbi:hypothetical protein BC939DRAFT_451971 [Gamsiella multidivaricata]|uniref:uncharacterized protein n=1 Tax=Gamsiella multidivaricata TaxID=101098 RepID=UPI002220162B|nr:uncharacterized protein BC939DRAFT_451971 [Gamsiella multidivaricata]KAG0367608.1 hypothetical protein BGZ54_003607 [Gamsiella multidivaricata]KAI7823389.1 hypothetical protein BC939DRAFT_451971 [Gamsiella multidivaricata]
MTYKKPTKIAFGVAIGATAVLAAPAAITIAAWGAGFGLGGIGAGTWAAGFMASYGGTVASGSACAVLQSIGTGALFTAGTAACATGGAAVGGAVAAALTPEEDKDGGKDSDEEGSIEEVGEHKNRSESDQLIRKAKNLTSAEPAKITKTNTFRAEVGVRDLSFSVESSLSTEIICK